MASMSKIALIALGAIALTSAASASAAVVYLDFEGIAPYPNASDVLIQNYYDGGAASNGNVGPALGVKFTSDALLLCLNNIGTTCSNTSRGDVGIPSSRNGALYFPFANPAMNVAAGFDTGFSFTYSAPYAAGTSVSIFAGLDGSGALLATSVLPLTPNGSGGCDAGYAANYCPFASFSLTFAGVAQSVVFGGSSNRQVFDDFTFGSATVGGIPEPASWTMLVVGFGLIGVAARRRQTIVAA